MFIEAQVTIAKEVKKKAPTGEKNAEIKSTVYKQWFIIRTENE